MPTSAATAPRRRAIARIWNRPWFPYAVAVAGVLASLLLRVALEPVFHARTLMVIFVPAVVLAAAMGGMGPALTATAVALLASLIFSGRTLLSDPANLTDALLFLALGPALGLAGRVLNTRSFQAADALQHLEEREAHLQSI